VHRGALGSKLGGQLIDPSVRLLGHQLRQLVAVNAPAALGHRHPGPMIAGLGKPLKHGAARHTKQARSLSLAAALANIGWHPLLQILAVGHLALL